ncbi:DUF6765 family protein [Clostridioides difficile]|uniref:DUF6765 family protein n=1 Tax=Clostridioides difficile TaxID=1496 RepID=UPI002FE350B4
MNLDFHYYGTYLAAKIAGYNDSDAETIAYAAQYVDESSKSMILDDVNFTLPTIQTNLELGKYYTDFTSWGYKWNLDRYIPNLSSTDDKVKIEKNNQDDFFKAFCQMVYALKCIKNGNDFSINQYDNLTENQKTEVTKVITTRKDDQFRSMEKSYKSFRI